MQYPLLGMKNAEEHCFVRREVYYKLLEAASLLPFNYKFKILDAWRPFDLQYELYEKYSIDIIKKFHLENCSNEYKKNIIKRFVSEPIANIDNPPVHTTGGAIDLTIIDENDKELNMGSQFDEFSKKTYTLYYENRDVNINTNRLLLYTIMTKVGFTNLPSEWWHFDFGDNYWSQYTNNPSIYNGIFTKNKIHLF